MQRKDWGEKMIFRIKNEKEFNKLMKSAKYLFVGNGISGKDCFVKLTKEGRNYKEFEVYFLIGKYSIQKPKQDEAKKNGFV